MHLQPDMIESVFKAAYVQSVETIVMWPNGQALKFLQAHTMLRASRFVMS